MLPEGGKVFNDGLKGLTGITPHLPYPVITIAFCDRQMQWLVVAAEPDRESAIHIAAAARILAQSPDDAWSPFALNEHLYLNLNDPMGAMNHTHGPYRALCELLEALSCKNVASEPIERVSPAVNARRIRRGKLPLYEVRRLVLIPGQLAVPKGDGSGHHSSPRQHLRRGHIRRLTSGNYWVNSCVVGLSSLGVIEKSYDITTRGAPT